MFKQIIVIAVILLVSFYTITTFIIKDKAVERPIQPTATVVTPTFTPTLTPTSIPKPAQEKVLLEVPFTSQAPFSEWKNPRFQDGCEEASVLMAIYWTKGEKFASIEQAKQEILALSKYQEDNFGEYRDTSTFDTAQRLIKGYYQYDNFEVKEGILLEDVIDQLNQGNIIIVPTNGQALKNPYFTPPGPERHMLVVIGFDKQKKEFITNDPGISQGAGYRYPQQVLFNAIRDYPTGYHLPINGVKKVMIVVKK